VLNLSSSDDLPGLLGIAISGAGPTVLAFARAGQEQEVGVRIVSVWMNASPDIECTTRHLGVDIEGIVLV
jgi:homoserine kinase